MKIMFIILGITVAVWCIVSNVYVIHMKSADEMRDEFIKGQCLVGRVFANIFYIPAWLFKGLRAVVVTAVK